MKEVHSFIAVSKREEERGEQPITIKHGSGYPTENESNSEHSNSNINCRSTESCVVIDPKRTNSHGHTGMQCTLTFYACSACRRVNANVSVATTQHEHYMTHRGCW